MEQPAGQAASVHPSQRCTYVCTYWFIQVLNAWCLCCCEAYSSKTAVCPSQSILHLASTYKLTTYLHKRIYIHPNAHPHIKTYKVHIYMYIYTHKHKHIHIHTHIQTRAYIQEAPQGRDPQRRHALLRLRRHAPPSTTAVPAVRSATCYRPPLGTLLRVPPNVPPRMCAVQRAGFRTFLLPARGLPVAV
jgi:hypothetical protein